jgi:hypothetical protein
MTARYSRSQRKTGGHRTPQQRNFIKNFNDSSVRAVLTSDGKHTFDGPGSGPEARPADILEIASLVQRTVEETPQLEQIILRFERRILTLSMRLLGTPDDAQDAAQKSSSVRSNISIESTRPGRSNHGWCATVNVCRILDAKGSSAEIRFQKTMPDVASEDKSSDPTRDLQTSSATPVSAQTTRLKRKRWP